MFESKYIYIYNDQTLWLKHGSELYENILRGLKHLYGEFQPVERTYIYNGQSLRLKQGAECYNKSIKADV